MDRAVHLTLKNNVKELSRLAIFLEQLAEEWSLTPNVMMAVNLSLEEAVSNIIFYAWADTNEHLIDLDFQNNDNDLTIVLTDDGKPFDPTKRDNPDINLPIEERPIGGLGILLIRKLMDGISYHRSGNKNQLTLIKKTCAYGSY